MSTQPRFFALIIGTEILNRRRVDKHFDYLSKKLLERGQKLFGSFVIEDDPVLIVQSIKFIASQPNSVLFSFGGIGSTPDDHTRKCSAIALRDGNLVMQAEAKAIIVDRLGERAYPHPINMAMLPRGAKLLHNVVNRMPAYYLDDRYFFMPGFPEMSHPMIDSIIEKFFYDTKRLYRYTLTAECRENELIDVMNQMPSGVEFSSLPKRYGESFRTTISVASHIDSEAKEAFGLYTQKLESDDIAYTLSEEHE